MNTRLLAAARRLFKNDLAPTHVQRHNMRAWARSVASLGSRWVYAQTYPASRLPNEGRKWI